MASKSLGKDTAAVALASVVLVVVAALVLDVRTLHFAGLGNDQASHVVVARNLVEHGRLESNLIYPSQLARPSAKNYFYMPGHYLALAASFALLGVGAFQAVVPSLVGYVATVVCTYLAGCRLYGHSKALVAAWLAALFPYLLVYACSAYPETLVTATCALAFCGFVYATPRWRLVVGPLGLALAFCFRETSAFLLVPMLVLTLRRENRWHWGETTGLAGIGVAVLTTVFVSDISAGRPSLLKANVLEGSYRAVYTDAYRAAELPSDPASVARAMVQKAQRNLADLILSLETTPTTLEAVVLAGYLSLLGLMFVLGMVQWRADPFLLAASAFAATMLGFLLFCYNLMQMTGVRLLLATWPLLAIALATVLVDRCTLSPSLVRWRQPGAAAAMALSLVVVGAVLKDYRNTYRRATDPFDRACLTFVESLRHDPATVLATPDHLPFPYVCRHYPVRWSFLPADRRTLELLLAQHDVGTMVLDVDAPGVEWTLADAEHLGLILSETRDFQGRAYFILRNRAASGSGATLAAPKLRRCLPRDDGPMKHTIAGS